MKKTFDYNCAVMPIIDLSLGSPYIFKEYLENNTQSISPSKPIEFHDLMPYNKTGVLPVFEQQVISLHKKYHPNIINKDTQIVVTNGATHALMALFHLVAKGFKNNEIYIPSPFWFRLPAMAEMQNSKVVEHESATAALFTIPNNPDGIISYNNIKNYENVWFDCVYNWPWYFKDEKSWKNVPFNQESNSLPDAVIFSMSKFSGHCGSRVGWVVVNNSNIAAFLSNYVEYDTSGVSAEAQTRCAAIIETFLSSDISNSYQKILNERKQQFETVYKKIYELTDKPLTDKDVSIDAGMFAWVKDQYKVLQKNNILGMSGSQCGGPEDFVRINLCCSDDNWSKTMNRLNNFIIKACDFI